MNKSSRQTRNHSVLAPPPSLHNSVHSYVHGVNSSIASVRFGVLNSSGSSVRYDDAARASANLQNSPCLASQSLLSNVSLPVHDCSGYSSPGDLLNASIEYPCVLANISGCEHKVSCGLAQSILSKLVLLEEPESAFRASYVSQGFGTSIPGAYSVCTWNIVFGLDNIQGASCCCQSHQNLMCECCRCYHFR